MNFGCLNGLFVLGRSMGFIGHHLDQLRSEGEDEDEILGRYGCGEGLRSGEHTKKYRGDQEFALQSWRHEGYARRMF